MLTKNLGDVLEQSRNEQTLKLEIYLFISPTVGTLTGYLSITKLNTKGRKVIVKGFLN